MPSVSKHLTILVIQHQVTEKASAIPNSMLNDPIFVDSNKSHRISLW